MDNEIKEYLADDLSIPSFVNIKFLLSKKLSQETTYRLLDKKTKKKIRERKYDADGRLFFKNSFKRDEDEYIEFLERTHTYQYLDDNLVIETIKDEGVVELWITRKFDDIGQLIYEATICNGDQSPAPYHFSYLDGHLVSITQKWKKNDVYAIGYKLEFKEKGTPIKRSILLDWKSHKLELLREMNSSGEIIKNTVFSYNGNSKLISIESVMNLTGMLFKFSTSYEYLEHEKIKKIITRESKRHFRKDSHHLIDNKLSIQYKIDDDPNYEVLCSIEEKEIESKTERNKSIGFYKEKTIELITSKKLKK